MRLILVVCAILAISPRVSAFASGPALQVTDPLPFTVVGVRFVPGERVTVVAQVEGRHVRVVVASDAGTFTVRFAVSLGPCPAYIVQATGNRGSHAYLRSVPECSPPGPAP